MRKFIFILGNNIQKIEASNYHWRELPQVPFFSPQKHVLVATKQSFVATKVCLSRQNVWRYKIIFVENFSFVATKARSILLSRQKTCFVATKMILVAASPTISNMTD